jgi:hypothetical protein
VSQITDAVDTVVGAPDDGWKYHPKHVEQFPDINKLCDVASCWIYTGILLEAHPTLHISRIKVKSYEIETHDLTDRQTDIQTMEHCRYSRVVIACEQNERTSQRNGHGHPRQR